MRHFTLCNLIYLILPDQSHENSQFISSKGFGRKTSDRNELDRFTLTVVVNNIKGNCALYIREL